jgi:uncharacterized protein
MATLSKNSHPWYRSPWPWFLMAFPAIAVIAGAVTAWLAVSTSDGLVVDDYYKQGLAIQQTMERSQRAVELGLQARVRVQADALELQLTGNSAEAVPEQVRISFSHPTRAGLDQTMVLAGAQGRFSGSHKDLVRGRWDIQIEDESRTWRLNGAANLPTETEIRIVPVISKPVD